jgi:hypothetical protein
MTVPVEPQGQPNHAPGWLEVLGATIAGTLSVGVNLAGPAWVAAVLGIAAPLVVGFVFPSAGTLPLVAGLLLAPLVAAVTRGERCCPPLAMNMAATSNVETAVGRR